jgi:Ca2+-binding RTX toxin-like protein
VNIGTASTDVIFVGITTRGAGTCHATYAGGGVCPASGVHNYACIRGSSPTSTATWYYLGNGLAGLYDNYDIHGNGGNDTMYIYRSNGNPAVGDTCRGGTYWNDPTGSNWIDLYGDAGSDTLTTSDQSGWYLWGGTGNDLLYGYSSQGALYGQDGDDILYGFTTSEAYDGGADYDCVEENNSNYGSALGGLGSYDAWSNGGAACPAGGGFERRITSGTCAGGYGYDAC